MLVPYLGENIVLTVYLLPEPLILLHLVFPL